MVDVEPVPQMYLAPTFLFSTRPCRRQIPPLWASLPHPPLAPQLRESPFSDLPKLPWPLAPGMHLFITSLCPAGMLVNGATAMLSFLPILNFFTPPYSPGLPVAAIRRPLTDTGTVKREKS